MWPIGAAQRAGRPDAPMGLVGGFQWKKKKTKKVDEEDAFHYE